MKDRFKFRVWNGKEMLYNSGLGYGEGNQLIEDKGHIIMQCTGLKDRNGKLIYEGDILQHPQLPHKVVCEWFQCGFWLNGYQNGAKRNLHDVYKFYEVIGNIYENKELLKEQK